MRQLQLLPPYLACIAIFATLAACAPAAENSKATDSAKNQAGSDSASVADSSRAADASVDADAAEVTTDANAGHADITPQPDAITDASQLADAVPELDAAAEDSASADVVDGVSLGDGAAGDSGSDDASSSDTSSAVASPDIGPDGNFWNNSSTWPPHAVAILDNGACHPLPPATPKPSEAGIFCQGDWSVCTYGQNATHAPCGWVRCCPLQIGFKPVPGCPETLKTFTGFFPRMVCPPTLNPVKMKSNFIDNPVGNSPHCCPKFTFMWP